MLKRIDKLFFLVLAILLSFCELIAGTLVDERDGQTYRTIEIGNQEWMAENLNYKASWALCYENEPANCQKYGRLYMRKVAKTRACPSGWRLPSVDEFESLIKIAGENLKSKKDWAIEGGNVDTVGFAAKPGGMFWGRRDGDFGDVNEKAYFWASNMDGIEIFGLGLSNQSNEAYIFRDIDNYYGFSVRCVKGETTVKEELSKPRKVVLGKTSPSKILKDSRNGKSYKTVKINNLVWMAENLNYETKDSIDDEVMSICYNKDPQMCDIYGRLYTRRAGLRACPNGWHLPNYAEAQSLIKAAGGTDVAGRILRARSDLWIDGSEGTDDLGFAALPAGSDVIDEGYFDAYAGKYAGFLIADSSVFVDSEGNVTHILPSRIGIWYSDESLAACNPSLGFFSVRCVKDYAKKKNE